MQKKRWFGGAALTIAAVMMSGSVHAQAPAGAGGGAGRGGAPAGVPASIDLTTAKRMAAASEAAAKAANASVAVVIVDANGDLVYFERMDGTSSRAVVLSQGKARAALLFGLPTKTVQDAAAAGKPVSAQVTVPPGGGNEITIIQGGLPVMKDGKIVAAIATGGSTGANDEKFAQAGLDAYTAQ